MSKKNMEDVPRCLTKVSKNLKGGNA
jgi:hypothetical protein